MTFDAYLSQAWDDHGDQSLRVAEEFPKGLGLASSADHLMQLMGLVIHVTGEHLGDYKKGVEILQKITTHSAFAPRSEVDQAFQRSAAALRLAANETVDLKSFSLSDQIRILAVASSALADRDTTRAQTMLLQAIKSADSSLEAKDPAYRSLAVTGNNLAAALERKTNRTAEQTELMIFAANTGRKFWEIAGTWNQVGYAEYRLAMSYLQANQIEKAHDHAQKALDVFVSNKGGELDLFYGNHALALVTKSSHYVETAFQHYEKMSAEDKKWCEPELKALKNQSY